MSTHMTSDRNRTQHALFAALLDDAAIFPPGSASMEQAVSAHRVWRASTWAPLVGPFICSSGRWDEFAMYLEAGAPLTVSLTLPGPSTLSSVVERALAEPRVELASVEVPCGREDLPTLLRLVSEAVPSKTRTYVELPWAAVDSATTQQLAIAGVRAKIRTGGTEPDAFPDEQQLATSLMACVTSRVPYKLTAGLHDAIRHRDSTTGFEHHGYLNVMCATSRALAGESLDKMIAALAQQNPATVADEVSALGAPTARAVRECFVSFGTCSLSDPLTGLLDLGLIQEDW